MIILRTMARFSGDWKLVKAEETDSGVPRPFCEKNMNYKILFIISWFKIGKKKFYFTVLRIKNNIQKEKKRNFQLKLVLHGDYLFLHYNFPNEAPLFHTENMKQISQKNLSFSLEQERGWEFYSFKHSIYGSLSVLRRKWIFQHTVLWLSSWALWRLLKLFSNFARCSKCCFISVAMTISMMACRSILNSSLENKQTQ